VIGAYGSTAFTVEREVTATLTDDGRVDLTEPQFIDDVRTLAVGDRVRIPRHGDWCTHAMPGGWVCSRTRGHDPHDYPHAAASRTDYDTGGDVDEAGPGLIHSVMDPEARDVTTDKERELSEKLAETERQLRLQVIRAERAHEARQTAETMIERIRDYAIDKMRDGTICQDGTREFLRHFDLPLWEQDYDVTFTVTVRRFTADDEDDAESKVRHELTHALRYVDNVEIEHSDTDESD
jgi:hypothetical protein